MSFHPTHPDLDPGQQAEDTQFYRQVLHDLINMGTDLARILHTQAVAQAQAALKASSPPEPIPDHTIAFDRIARAIRRSIALARSLAAPAPARTPAQHRTAARKRILRAVEDAIGRIPANDDDGSLAEPRDRPDAPDLEDDIKNRPIPEIIAEICRDLGLAAHPGTHPVQRGAPADIQQLCARAAVPGTPRHPSPASHGPDPVASEHIPGPPDPSAALRPGPVPTEADNTHPADPAEPTASTLRPSGHADARWRPPPSG